ncbi:MAG: 4Fe-4S dicluster domain-containing protein [Chloroflexi bacterium]|nr:4Fe-4S dicluster domain-containing protein [Chloroflexota bacterium]
MSPTQPILTLASSLLAKAPDMPGREDFWNIGYPLFGVAAYLFFLILPMAIGLAIYKRYRIWRLGRPMPDLGPWGPRIKRAIGLLSRDVLAHHRFIKREVYPGIMHFFLFWGLTVLLIATTVSGLEFWSHKYLSFNLPTTPFRVQADFLWDVFGGGFVLAGLAMAAIRRYFIRPKRLTTFADDTVFLGLLAILVLTGFTVEGLRIAGSLAEGSMDWAERAAPIGWLFSRAFTGMDRHAIGIAHAILWWTHIYFFMTILVYVATRFSKISHIFLSPANILLRSDRPLGALRPMGDLEKLERFGASDLPDFTWKQLLDFDACTNCGRCQDNCPAYLSGKELSPRKLIQDLRAYSSYRGPQLLAARAAGQEAPPPDKAMIADFVGTTPVWDCVTCRACMEACPVYIEHIDSIVDMRRHLVMEQAAMPEGAQGVLESMERRGHPWRGAQATRTDWMDGTDVKTLADDADVEVLLWVGCTPALNVQNQRVPRAMASLLKVAGVKFGVLGNEETCTGDPARRLGNELLFQMMAQQNIQTFKSYNVKKVITLCPHCFNAIKNDYPQLGSNVEVVHYTEFVDQLIKEGRLKPVKSVNIEMTYHDSCYLGRHNRVFDAPRSIARAIPGLTLHEMDRRREHGFCCGAGAGHMWMEDSGGQRINHMRTDQFLETKGNTLGVSCPFCLQMFQEGIASKGVAETKQTKDLLEVVVESVGVEPGT